MSIVYLADSIEWTAGMAPVVPAIRQIVVATILGSAREGGQSLFGWVDAESNVAGVFEVGIADRLNLHFVTLARVDRRWDAPVVQTVVHGLSFDVRNGLSVSQ